MSRAAVPSVSRKVGSGRSHGTPSKDEQREGGESSCSLFFLALRWQLTCVFVPSLWSSPRLSLASAMLFFSLFCFIWWGLFQTREPFESCCRHGLDRKFIITFLVLLPFFFWRGGQLFKDLVSSSVPSITGVHSGILPPPLPTDSNRLAQALERSLMDPVYQIPENAGVSQIKCHLKLVF